MLLNVDVLRAVRTGCPVLTDLWPYALYHVVPINISASPRASHRIASNPRRLAVHV